MTDPKKQTEEAPVTLGPRIETPDTMLGGWVYCGQHLNPHRTGWCTVGIEDKVGLGPMAGKSFDEQRWLAVEKCRRLGLKLYER